MPTQLRKNIYIVGGLLALTAFYANTRRLPDAAHVEAADANVFEGSREKVGPAEAGRAVLPVNQAITPAGRQVELKGLRPQALALSPDGKLLVTSGKTSSLVVLDPAT